jgi:hypothetical protein
MKGEADLPVQQLPSKICGPYAANIPFHNAFTPDPYMYLTNHHTDNYNVLLAADLAIILR